MEIQEHFAQTGRESFATFMIGHADVPTSVRAMKTGAPGFLNKPVCEQGSFDAVAEALRQDPTHRTEVREIPGIRAVADALPRREVDVQCGVRRRLLRPQIAHELEIGENTIKNALVEREA